MGCSPSTLHNSSSSTAPAAAASGAAAGGPLPPLDANEKDGSLLFCIKLRRSRMRRCSCGAVTLQQNQNGDGSTGSAGGGVGSNCAENMMCNQVLLNPQQSKNESDYEKVSSVHSATQLTNWTDSLSLSLFCLCCLLIPACSLALAKRTPL